MNCFELLGLNQEGLETVAEWARERSVSLRFKSEEACSFIKSKERKEETPTLVTETSGILGKGKKTQKIVEKVTDYYWLYKVSYEIFLFRGNDSGKKVHFPFAFCSPLGRITRKNWFL
jgi:hypothetical protein